MRGALVADYPRERIRPPKVRWHPALPRLIEPTHGLFLVIKMPVVGRRR